MDIKKLKELIRKTPLERKKRRKRQPPGYPHPHYRLSGITPTNTRVVMLQSKTGYYLEILPDGKVGGNINRTKFSKYFQRAIVVYCIGCVQLLVLAIQMILGQFLAVEMGIHSFFIRNSL